MQNGVCLLCKKAPIEHYHHLIPKERRGSENVTNRAGLCLKCHAKVHTNPKATERLSKLKTGMNKKYHTLSCINQMMKPFINWVEAEFPDHTYLIQGNDTKQYRERYNLDKGHNIDAYSVAATTMFSGACSCAHANALAGTQVCKSNRTNQNLTQGVACEEDAAANDFSPVSLDVTPDLNMPPVYFVKQYRCHDRANIKAQVYRTYKYDGKVVAKNRHPAYEAIVAKDGKIVQKKQKTPALDQCRSMVKHRHERCFHVSKLRNLPGGTTTENGFFPEQSLYTKGNGTSGADSSQTVHTSESMGMIPGTFLHQTAM